MSPRGRRYSTALCWTAAGSMHFLRPRFYEAIVPPPLDRYKREVVIVSGLAELAGGVAILPARTRPLARAWLLATLAGVYRRTSTWRFGPSAFSASLRGCCGRGCRCRECSLG